MMGVGWSNKELLSIHKAAVRKLPLLLGKKKMRQLKKNKGKPSGLFNHLVYFCKKRQNKIMHRIRSPVRADLRVRKLRPVVFQFFYAFFHCLSPCPVFAVNLHYWENLREGMRKRSHPLTSVQFNLSQLLNALFGQWQKIIRLEQGVQSVPLLLPE